MEVYGTIGPACAESVLLTKMFQLGMTGMRLNLSHTDLSDCRGWLEIIQRAAEAAGVSPRLLVDLQGPELRIGILASSWKLAEGEQVLLIPRRGEKEAAHGILPVPPELLPWMKPGQQILLDDGKILLKVLDCEDMKAFFPSMNCSRICCQVLRGGVLTSRKSIALPGIETELPTLTESDQRNLQEAKSHGVTGVMLPFVRKPQDLLNLRQALIQAGAPELEVFAKIENTDGVKNLKSFLPYADQIVIARGDLGNDMPLWELPAVQAEIAGICREAGKPFMVVTQMLASMEHSRVPTRAEVSDIFLAAAQGASSVMLTGETASGRYPLEAMEYLCKTAASAEKYVAGRRS